ncbi:MAG: hypothetical protein ACKVWR_12820 [Acidimicrobiales bacterium]
MTKTTASELTLVTGLGRVPVTRSQIAVWRKRIDHAREVGARSHQR